jgi:hypothetical protein
MSENGPVKDAANEGAGPASAEEAQALHDRRRSGDAEHDRAGCWCCCLDCDFDFDALTAAT